MNVARRMSHIPNGSDFGPKALYLLAAPTTPEAAREEAVARATAGESITPAVAPQIVAAHKPDDIVRVVPTMIPRHEEVTTVWVTVSPTPQDSPTPQEEIDAFNEQLRQQRAAQQEAQGAYAARLKELEQRGALPTAAPVIRYIPHYQAQIRSASTPPETAWRHYLGEVEQKIAIMGGFTDRASGIWSLEETRAILVTLRMCIKNMQEIERDVAEALRRRGGAEALPADHQTQDSE
jgi:hypothetical protein